MISGRDLVGALDRHRFAWHTGVPCSYFTDPIAVLTAQDRYLPAANEGIAVATAAGASAGGVRAAVFAQNSGFGNLLNPLTSLVMPYHIGVLLLMSLRGWPDPAGDEPQHAVMGATTHRLLGTLGMWNETVRTDAANIDDILDRAVGEVHRGRPAFVLFEKGAIAAAEANAATDPAAATVSRAEGLQAILAGFPDALVVATTGYASRELFHHGDSDRFFYMQGSMGHASAFGLGVALAAGQGRRVVVLDGDGAALMHLGAMSTVAAAGPAGLIHVIFDNGVYESTGSQCTTSATTSFAAIALAAGYRSAAECASIDDIGAATARAAITPGPHVIVVRTALGSGPAPPRATSALPAERIHKRFAATAAARR